MEYTKLTEVEEIILNRTRFKLQNTLGRYSMENLEVMFQDDDILDKMILKFQTYIMTDNLVEKYELKYKTPSNWFQMLKESHAPKWYLDKYPVEYIDNIKIVKLESKHLYPRMDLDPGRKVYVKQQLKEV